MMSLGPYPNMPAIFFPVYIAFVIYIFSDLIRLLVLNNLFHVKIIPVE